MSARHGSESFFIEGEGLVNTQLGGRHGEESDPITDPDTQATAAKLREAGAAAVLPLVIHKRP